MEFIEAGPLRVRAPTGKLTGLFLELVRDSTSYGKKKLSKGLIFLAVGEAGGGRDEWVPALLRGGLDYVRRADVQKIVPPGPPRIKRRRKPKVKAKAKRATASRRPPASGARKQT